MKLTYLFLVLLALSGCGKSGATSASALPIKNPTTQCLITSLPMGGWAFSNPGGMVPYLSDCGNNQVTFVVAGVTAPAVPVSMGATNGMTFSPVSGVCAGQPGITRAPNFSELYFVFGTTSTPTTFLTSLVGNVENLSFVIDTQIYTYSSPGYSCKVSFVGGVPTYH